MVVESEREGQAAGSKTGRVCSESDQAKATAQIVGLRQGRRASKHGSGGTLILIDLCTSGIAVFRCRILRGASRRPEQVSIIGTPGRGYDCRHPLRWHLGHEPAPCLEGLSVASDSILDESSLEKLTPGEAAFERIRKRAGVVLAPLTFFGI